MDACEQRYRLDGITLLGTTCLRIDDRVKSGCALFHRGRGQRPPRDRAFTAPHIEKEERLVFDDRATDGGAGLISFEFRFCWSKRVLRIELSLQELESGAVNLIGSRPRREVTTPPVA